MVCGGGGDGGDDRGPRPGALAPGDRLGAAVPRRGDGGAPSPSHSWFLDLLRRSRLRAAAATPGACAARGAAPTGSAALPAAERHARPGLGGRAAAARHRRPRRPARLILLVGGLRLVHLLSAAAAAQLGRRCWARGSSTLAARAGLDPRGHALGGPGRARDRPVAAAVAPAPAGGAGRGLVPGADALPGRASSLLHAAGVGLGWGSIVLMLLGTQWYILFNVVAGASSVPSDLREAARSFRLGRWRRLSVALPAGHLPVPGDRLGDRRRRGLERDASSPST